MKQCHRFWVRLRHAVILISNDRTSALKKINGMGLIRTLNGLDYLRLKEQRKILRFSADSFTGFVFLPEFVFHGLGSMAEVYRK